MKAWLINQLTGIDNLHIADVPDPTPAPGEAVLEVRYAALNPADRYLAERQYPANPPLPHILGRDAVGAAISVAAGAEQITRGRHYSVLRGDVGVSRAGTFAQRVAVPAGYLVDVPEGWTEQEAAGATLVYLTSYQALTTWGDLPPSIVLVTGASGGVGVASVQLAAAMGHTIIALSRNPQKRDRLLQLGAAAAFDPHDPQWRKSLKSFLGQRRVDLAIDNIGGTLFSEVVDVLGDRGRVSCVGRLAGPVPQFNTASLFFRRIRIGGVAVGAYTNAEARSAWQNVLSLLRKTGAKPLVDSIFPFDQLPAAFARLAEGPMGKVLLAVIAK